MLISFTLFVTSLIKTIIQLTKHGLLESNHLVIEMEVTEKLEQAHGNNQQSISTVGEVLIETSFLQELNPFIVYSAHFEEGDVGRVERTKKKCQLPSSQLDILRLPSFLY